MHTSYRWLRITALAFAASLVLHGIDHALRGMDVVSPQVAWAGNVQVVGAIVAVTLVLLRHRFASLAAVVMGFVSAAGFTAAHLLPTWSAFSDSFVTPAPGAGITAYSWVTAVLEISAGLAFGVAGVLALRRERTLAGSGLRA